MHKKYSRKPSATCDRIEVVQRLVCSVYGICFKEMVGPRRPARIAWPRQVAMHLCFINDLGSYQQIGIRFGGRDHGTVMHANRVVTHRISTEAMFRWKYYTCRDAVEKALGSILHPTGEQLDSALKLSNVLDSLQAANNLAHVDYVNISLALSPDQILRLLMQIQTIERSVFAPFRHALMSALPESSNKPGH